MRSKLLFLIVLILAMAALSGTVQANYYSNPGFEDYDGAGLPDWWSAWSGYGAGTYDYHIDDAVARTGEDCMEVGSPFGGSGDFQWVFEDIEGMSGDTAYTIGGWFKDVTVGATTEGEVEIAFEWWITRDEDKISYVTNQFSIPDDGGWHWVSWTQVSPPGTLLVSPMVGTDGNGESAYLIDDVVFRLAKVSNPDPGHNSKVQAPGTVDLKWENSSAETCTIYWDNGNNDVNDINFQHHVVNSLGTKVYLLDTVLNDEPNEVLSNAVAAGKNYCWRVDVGSEAGAVWNFSTINEAPEVDAGPKQALWQDSVGSSVTFQLAPVVSDDGLPVPPGAVTYLWTKTGASSTGTVTFTPGGATSTALAPTVTMSDPCAVGDYELTLTVDDGSALTGSDTVKIRVHANDTTGLEARYDCEEGNAAAGIHDDYSGYDKNPTPVVNPPTRRGERMDDIDTAGTTGTTMDTTGGKLAQPVQNAGDTTKGGIIFNGGKGHVETLNSSNDPNIDPEDPAWADFRDEVTVGAWIKIDTENGGWNDNKETIIAKGEQSYRLHRNGSGDSIQFTVNIDEVEYVAEGTTAVNDGEWHHVMGTYDGTEVCIYVDGLPESCVDAEGPIDWKTGNEGDNPALTIGLSKENSGAVYGGLMDEIRVHSIGLPHRSDNPEAVPVTETNARSIVSIYRTSDGHANCGGAYMDGDASGDCYVNLDDVKVIAGVWLECNSIARPECDAYWK